MRLIDADELKRSISQNNKIPRIFQQVINAQPTVYDIDKAVEQLDNASKADRYDGMGGYVGKKTVYLDDAIEIVKHGCVGTDDVCEWKQEDDNLITSCGDYFNILDNCTEKFDFCPKCGKKIKVVE